jgi:hypothetical protein
MVILVEALVMKIFEPLMIHLPSFGTALVLVPPASEPASGSVSPKPQSLPLRISGRSSRRCFSLPY